MAGRITNNPDYNATNRITKCDKCLYNETCEALTVGLAADCDCMIPGTLGALIDAMEKETGKKIVCRNKAELARMYNNLRMPVTFTDRSTRTGKRWIIANCATLKKPFDFTYRKTYGYFQLTD